MKIFIIEDEPAIREELVQLLQKYGYQCDSSDDFHHIVQAALSSGANLILLDINLPYQDGFQVCREIRQKSNLPIIVLTSRNSDFDELMSLNIGADDYIAKPYNAQILLARIQKLLARTYEVQDNIVLTHKGLCSDSSDDTLRSGSPFDQTQCRATHRSGRQHGRVGCDRCRKQGDLQRDSGLCVETPSVKGFQSLYRTGEAEVQHHRARELQ